MTMGSAVIMAWTLRLRGSGFSEVNSETVWCARPLAHI
jgi:hypothetical protein